LAEEPQAHDVAGAHPSAEVVTEGSLVYQVQAVRVHSRRAEEGAEVADEVPEREEAGYGERGGGCAARGDCCFQGGGEEVGGGEGVGKGVIARGGKGEGGVGG
jgi:hypothetical protein